MLVLRTSARPGAIRKMPPGPGRGAMTNPAMMSRTPAAKIDHSTMGLSMKRSHCLRVIMGPHVVTCGGSRKALAVNSFRGLALTAELGGFLTTVECSRDE